MAILAAEAVRRFGIEPKVALLSHSNFGMYDHPSARKMSEARLLQPVKKGVKKGVKKSVSTLHGLCTKMTWI